MTGHDVGGNRFDGEAHGVVQAHNFHGDVHFHAPESPNPPPKQVPPPSRFFTNNERQLGDISKYLKPGAGAEERPPALVVVQGPPGSGKSETAYQWVQKHRGHYPDGAFYARLTAESGMVGEALHQFLLAIGYKSAELPAGLDARSNLFRSWTSGKKVVVVIDDAITAAQVLPLLPGAGNSAVLVTEARSLSSLRVRAGAEFVPLDPLTDDAARLLLSRIVGEAKDLTGEPEQVDRLIELCEGQTIALCVAASELARAPERPVARLVRELSKQRLGRLSRDADLSVKAVFNTAVARLDERAKQLYAAFGQHPGAGEVSLAALAAAVDLDEDDVREALDLLVSAHLIREVAEDRYFAYSLVREHARPLGSAEMRNRFTEFYVRRALSAGHAVQPKRGWLEALWPGFRPEPVTADEAREWLAAERANLRAVASELRAAGAEQVCQLAVALWPFQEQGKHVDDMDVLNEYAVEVADHRELTFAAGLALIQRGFAFRARGESDKAAGLFAEGEARARAVARDDLAATAVESLGISLRDQGDREAARTALERNLGMAEQLGDPRRLALARMHLGSVAEPQLGEQLLDQALAAFATEPYNAAKTRMWRGRRRTELERYDEANADLSAALEYMTEHGHHFDRAQVLVGLGDNASAAGDAEAAQQHFLDAAAICRTRGFAELGEQVQARLDQS